VSLHPGMLVTFHRNQNFRARKGLLNRRSSIRLSLIPFRVVLGRWVDIVLRWIAVGDAQLLAGHHAQYVRAIVAAILIQRRGRAGSGPCITIDLGAVSSSAFFDVNEDVRE